MYHIKILLRVPSDLTRNLFKRICNIFKISIVGYTLYHEQLCYHCKICYCCSFILASMVSTKRIIITKVWTSNSDSSYIPIYILLQQKAGNLLTIIKTVNICWGINVSFVIFICGFSKHKPKLNPIYLKTLIVQRATENIMNLISATCTFLSFT